MSQTQDFYGNTNIGGNVAGRIVTQQDKERWEKQRLERKRKRLKLDPYRY